MKRSGSNYVRSALASILTILLSTTIYAQTIDEIVVTAQKRSENLQDVPIAVSAFSAKALEKAGFDDLGEIAYAVPSMSIATHFQFANPKIYLRGVGNNEYQANAVGSVAVYQDDVYLAGFFFDEHFAGVPRTSGLKFSYNFE